MNPSPTRLPCDFLICFAVREEARFFIPHMGNHCQAIVTGMGAGNTGAALGNAWEKYNPRHILTCGFAGALDPALAVGDVCFATSDSVLGAAAKSAGARRATFHSSSRVAVTAAEKSSLRAATGLDAVEMESAVIVSAARERGLPVAIVRVISDTAGEDLPLDFNALMTAKQSIHFPKLLVALARSPGKIPALLTLQKNTTLAARHLAATLVKITSR